MYADVVLKVRHIGRGMGQMYAKQNEAEKIGPK